MEFETTLSPEQIKARLLLYTKPLMLLDAPTDHQFLSKWNRDDSFYLFKTGGVFSVRPFLPFIGKVEQQGDHYVISGKFDLIKRGKIMLAGFFGLAWLSAAVICFFNPNYPTIGKIIPFLALSIWTIILNILFRHVPSLFQKKQQAEVIQFIKEHL